MRAKFFTYTGETTWHAKILSKDAPCTADGVDVFTHEGVAGGQGWKPSSWDTHDEAVFKDVMVADNADHIGLYKVCFKETGEGAIIKEYGGCQTRL